MAIKRPKLIGNFWHTQIKTHDGSVYEFTTRKPLKEVEKATEILMIETIQGGGEPLDYPAVQVILEERRGR